MKKKQIEFYCCEQGREYICDFEHDPFTDKTYPTDPYIQIHEMYDDWENVRIKFCPWCGKRAAIK